jgi:hypothetical protein
VGVKETRKIHRANNNAIVPVPISKKEDDKTNRSLQDKPHRMLIFQAS